MYDEMKLDNLINIGLPVNMVAFLVPIEYEFVESFTGESNVIIKKEGGSKIEYFNTKHGPIKVLRSKAIDDITIIDLVSEIVLDNDLNVLQYK